MAKETTLDQQGFLFIYLQQQTAPSLKVDRLANGHATAIYSNTPIVALAMGDIGTKLAMVKRLSPCSFAI